MSETVNRETDVPHDDNLPEQTRHIVIPSYAAWFDYNRLDMKFLFVLYFVRNLCG